MFPLAMLALWLLLAVAFVRELEVPSKKIYCRAEHRRLLGLLAFLLIVPFILTYLASSPNYYPAINPDTGGPTGASQLESSLIIVAILLMLPFGLTQRNNKRSGAVVVAWALLIAESFLCLAIGRADASHRLPIQFLSLGCLLIWIPLTPVYYADFEWNANTRLWRIAFFSSGGRHWFSQVGSSFFPGILDHFKFTDGLVGHSLLAMAGFTSSLLIFVLVQLLGEDGWIFNRARSFYGWNMSPFLAYVMLMTAAGWREGFDPTFTILPGVARHVIYILRLVVGGVMLAASLDWLIDAATLLRESSVVHATQEATS
jgi:cytochrome c oxidase cbb3-type subunit 1